MFFKTQLQLIQGQAGYRPGTIEWLKNEKWVVIKFQAIYIGPATESPTARMYEFMGTDMSSTPLMGRYSIENTDKGPNSSYVIGNFAPPQSKVWQYDFNNRILRLGTMGEYTGTQETNNEHEFKIVPDVELHHAFPTARGFVVGGGGWYGYGQGIVKTKSPTDQPFQDRAFYWTTL